MNPWEALPESPPHVLPEDASYVEQFNQRGALSEQLHLELMAEPFLGDPLAPVVLLNGNPGFAETDPVSHRDARFMAAARRNLLHSPAEWPLFLLDPALTSAGHDWWRRRTRSLAEAVGGYQQVARSVFVMETHGYHASRYRRINLPSQQYTRELVRAAINRKAILIVMRARREWWRLVPELSMANAFSLRSPQNVSVSPKNCPDGFASAVAAIRNDVRRTDRQPL